MSIETNVALWQARIGEAAARWGGCEICAVTKTVPPERINRVWDCGIRTIGENRVQELLGKFDSLNPGFEIHLIGQLQTNKVRQVMGRVAMVQSLDRENLAEALDRRAGEAGLTIDALVEVGIAGEAQKGGIDPEHLIPFLQTMDRYGHLRVRGLMAVMPIADDPEDVRPWFRKMRQWFERLRDMDLPNVRMDVLSMGMSDDALVAAQEGATMVRLGRALFGDRSR